MKLNWLSTILVLGIDFQESQRLGNQLDKSLWQVWTTDCPDEARGWLELHDFDLLLIEDEMDALDFIISLRKINIRVPAFIFCADPQIFNGFPVPFLGIRGILKKPFTLQEFATAYGQFPLSRKVRNPRLSF